MCNAGDVKRVMNEVDFVVSCLGGFSTNDEMRALNGDANKTFVLDIDPPTAICEERWCEFSSADGGVGPENEI